MYNINKSLPELKKLLNDKNYTKKVLVYLSTASGGDDYDKYEKNYTYTNHNYITIKAIVRDIAPESAYFKLYGQHKTDVKELLCENKWKTALETCNKIEIDNLEYSVFKDMGGKLNIINRPHRMIRVTITRKE